MSKTKYTVHVSARAKDKMDAWRLATGVGRYPLASKVHKRYADNRNPACKRDSKFSVRTPRNVSLQTNLSDAQVADLLEFANSLDIFARYDTTDSSMISYLLGTFLDAVIMGDLVDTTDFHDAIAARNNQSAGQEAPEDDDESGSLDPEVQGLY